MDETKQMHDLAVEWACIANLADRIMTLAESAYGDWSELTDMVADAMTEEGGTKDPASVFFNLYGFLFRLYFRLRAKIEKAPFNRYVEKDEEFWVVNYDYKVYKWALSKGFSDGVDNLVIKVPKRDLSDAQIESLRKRC